MSKFKDVLSHPYLFIYSYNYSEIVSDVILWDSLTSKGKIERAARVVVLCGQGMCGRCSTAQPLYSVEMSHRYGVFITFGVE